MTVKEMMKMTSGDVTLAFFDFESGQMIYNEYLDKQKDDVGYSKFEECEVISVGAYKQNEIALYVDAPARRFETWLDVTYSLKIQLDVPYGENESAILASHGDSILKALPKTITINDMKWEYGYDNMDSGSFYDLIEEM